MAANPLAGVNFKIGIVVHVDDKELKEWYPFRGNARINRLSEGKIASFIGGRLGSGERLQPDVLDINVSLAMKVAKQFSASGRVAEGKILSEFLTGLTELEIKQTKEGSTTKLFELQILDSKGKVSDNPLARRVASGNITQQHLKEGNTVEDYKKSDVDKRITMITSQGWLKLLDSNSTLKEEARRKLRNLAIITERPGKRLAFYGLREFQYNLKYMKADVRYDKTNSIKIRYLLKDNVEQAIIQKIEKAIVETHNLRMKSLKFSELLKISEQLKFSWPSGGSIPFMAVSFRRGMAAPDKGSGSSPASQPAKRSSQTTQFISREVLSALIRDRVARDMPHGPIGGRPLSPIKLTYRTGRFVNSIKIDFLDFKRRILTYFYNPIYTVHEQTRRDPRRLVENNIKLELQQRYGQQFRIFKSHAIV